MKEFKFQSNKLIAMMKEKEWTQSYIAKKINKSQSGLNGILNGKMPRPQTIQALAELFNISPLELFTPGRLEEEVLPANFLEDERQRVINSLSTKELVDLLCQKEGVVSGTTDETLCIVMHEKAIHD